MGLEDYRENISYDANGNILTYKRNGKADKLDMDKMTYQYAKDAAGNAINNRLRYVHDEVAAANYAEDIDSQTALSLAQVQAEKLPEQPADNYSYDAIGNLVKDTKEGISSINWNVYGKISSITKTGSIINYGYDAAGNRISKTISTNQPINQSTFYVRDASGNVMSVYSIDPLVNQGKVLQSELHLYGSSRLGIVNTLSVAPQIKPMEAGYGEGKLSTFTRGEKFFELSNHLGNVMATVSDKKLQVDANADGLVDFYTAEVVSANDYAPFGMSLSGRKFNGGNYRFGFNGQMKDNDIDAGGNHYTAEFWEYSADLGRRWNLDPKPTDGVSGYATFNNNPILFIDPLGDTSVPTPGGARMELSPNSFKTFDGGTRNLVGSSIKVKPASGTLESFTSGSQTFTASFGSQSGKFKGYINVNTKQTFEDYTADLLKNYESYERIEQYEKIGIWDRNVSDGQAGKNALNFGLGVVLPNPIFKAATAAANAEKIAGFTVNPNKFNYFFGRVLTGAEHNITRSAQNLKDLTTLGIQSEKQLMGVFNQAMKTGTTISTKTSQYGTTVLKSVTIGNKGSINVGFFYQGSKMSATPSVSTIIPKIFK